MKTRSPKSSARRPVALLLGHKAVHVACRERRSTPSSCSLSCASATSAVRYSLGSSAPELGAASSRRAQLSQQAPKHQQPRRRQQQAQANPERYCEIFDATPNQDLGHVHHENVTARRARTSPLARHLARGCVTRTHLNHGHYAPGPRIDPTLVRFRHGLPKWATVSGSQCDEQTPRPN